MGTLPKSSVTAGQFSHRVFREPSSSSVKASPSSLKRPSPLQSPLGSSSMKPSLSSSPFLGDGTGFEACGYGNAKAATRAPPSQGAGFSITNGQAALRLSANAGGTPKGSAGASGRSGRPEAKPAPSVE